MRVAVVLTLLVVAITAQDIFVDPDYVSSIDDSTDDLFVGPEDVKDVTEDLEDYERPEEEVETDIEEPVMEKGDQDEKVRLPDVPHDSDFEEEVENSDEDFEETDMVDEDEEPKEEEEPIEPEENSEEPEVTTEVPRERKSWPFRPWRPFSHRKWPSFGDFPFRPRGRHGFIWGGRGRGIFGGRRGGLFDGLGMDFDDLFRPGFGGFGRRGPHRRHGGKHTASNQIGCTICKSVVGLISFEVKNANASIEFIERVVKKMCKLNPIEVAKEACDKIVDEIDQVVQLIEKDVEPNEICQELKLCSNTSSSTINPHHMRRLYSPRRCGVMCKHLKLVNSIGFNVQMEKLDSAREMMNGFCKENKISTKCKYIMHLMNKTEAEMELIFAEENEAYCECDKRAPWSFFMHRRRENNMCDTCKAFETGMIEDLKEAHQTIEMLLDEINEVCSAFPDPIKTKCTTIAAEIKAFTEYVEKKLDPSGVCVAMGICHEKKNKPVMGRFQERISSILKPGGIFNILNPWGGNTDRRPHKNGTECSFCTSCVKELTPDAESKGKDFVKKSLSMICESKSNGTDVSTVCKKMVDGVETVDKIHRKLATFKMPRLCELLDIC